MFHNYSMWKEFSKAMILSKIRYSLSLWGTLFPIPGMMQDKTDTGNKQSLLKIECGINHVARIIISC